MHIFVTTLGVSSLFRLLRINGFLRAAIRTCLLRLVKASSRGGDFVVRTCVIRRDERGALATRGVRDQSIWDDPKMRVESSE